MSSLNIWRTKVCLVFKGLNWTGRSFNLYKYKKRCKSAKQTLHTDADIKTLTYNSINGKTSIRTKLNNDMTIARETYYYI
jgi:hypothetical protein